MKILKKIKTCFKYIKNGDFLYEIYNRKLLKIDKKRKFSKKYEFINRQKGTDDLVIILAGFQPFYWDVLLNNVYAANIDKYDVCLCIPEGTNVDKLRDISKKYNWSFLRIRADKLGLVQNIAIKLHPNAKKIFKLDEDIVIDKNFFIGLKHTESCLKNYVYDYGFIAPMININYATQFDFLTEIGKLDEFVDKFGFHKVCDNEMHVSVDIAEYLTYTIIPDFNRLSNDINKNNKGKFKTVPTRYSIGAIYFSREFWEKIGYFYVGTIGVLGGEEQQVCNYCMDNSMPIICSMETIAGHLGYYLQKETCKKIFLNSPSLFDTSGNVGD